VKLIENATVNEVMAEDEIFSFFPIVNEEKNLQFVDLELIFSFLKPIL
jgi:hypothetical protein